MAKKRIKKAKEQIDSEKVYNLDEGIKLVLDTATAGFDESVDVAIKLGADAAKSDQQVRGALALPHGLGKKVSVLVFAKGAQEEEAKQAGADYVGAEDLIEKIQKGWMDFDRVISTPDMMATVSKVAKVLGPKGLMPNPKTGTVTPKVGDAVKAEKSGKAAFRMDKNGILHTCIGKKSMGFDQLKKNYLALASEVIKLKPKSSKGIYLQAVSMSSTMGPGVALNTTQTQNEAV